MNRSPLLGSVFRAVLLIPALLFSAAEEATLSAQETDIPAVEKPTPNATTGEESSNSESTEKPKAGKPEVKPKEKSKKVSLITVPFSDELWTHFSGKKGTTRKETWSVVKGEKDEPILVCTGEPYGYLRTKKEFTNFEFSLEWKFPKDVNGNSGVLLHTTGDDRIWPMSMQVQLQQTVAGSTFPSGGAKSENELRNIPMLAKPVDQWNVCHIICRDGNVTVTINDQKVGEVTGCNPAKGSIALQSQGAEIHFRRIWYRKLEPTTPKADPPTETSTEPASTTLEKEDDQSSTSIWFRQISSEGLCHRDRVIHDICSMGSVAVCTCTSQVVFYLDEDSSALSVTGMRCRKARKRRKPQVIQTLSQAARGDRRKNTEWVVLYSSACN